MQKRGFETDQKCFRDFEIVLKFFETHVFFNKYLATLRAFPSCFIVINFVKSIKTRDHGGSSHAVKPSPLLRVCGLNSNLKLRLS